MIALPFSQRMTASAAVFACIFIAGPLGAQKFTSSGSVIGALQLDYAQLLHLFHQLRHQDVSNQAIVLADVVSMAVTTVTNLNATIDALMSSGDGGFLLQGMKIIAANALTNLKNVQSDE